MFSWDFFVQTASDSSVVFQHEASPVSGLLVLSVDSWTPKLSAVWDLDGRPG